MPEQRLDDRIAEPGDEPCAVEDCANRGRPQVCPYDQRYHHHGRVHYGTIPSALAFREGGWSLVCDAHLKHLTDELDAHRLRQLGRAPAIVE